MVATWRFQVLRFDSTDSFIRRPVGPFVGGIEEALAFANRVQDHFGDHVRRVEAWSLGQVEEPEPGDRIRFEIVRHENGRDWRLLESRLTHPAWYRKLPYAINYAAFRGRGHALQFCIGSPIEVLIVTGGAEPLPRNEELPSAAAFTASAVS